MTDVEKLLLNTIKPALAELTKSGVGLYDTADNDGIHYLFDGEYYLISVKKKED